MCNTSILYAIDPGKTGAIARFLDGKLAGVLDPVDGSLGAPLAEQIVEDAGAELFLVIERVGGLPGQSGPAAFNFGQNYGEVLGVCMGLAVEYRVIPPAVWKGTLGLRHNGESLADWKRLSLDLAQKQWPLSALFSRAKDNGRAEAALLGHYWLTQGLKA